MVKIGDKVKFLNDVGGGIVTSFISKDMVNVENEDGFEIPYPIIQLVNTSAPELNKDFVQKEEKTGGLATEVPVFVEQQGEIINGKNSPDFYFCFVPADPANPAEDEIALYLVNDSNFTIMYHFAHVGNNLSKTVKYGNVQPNSQILLETLAQNNLQELPGFGFQLLYFKDTDSGINKPVVKTFRVSPVKFHKQTSFTNNRFFRKNAMTFQIVNDILSAGLDKLTESDFRKVIHEKEAKPITKKPQRKKTPEIIEIDLHINQLLDNANGLSNREILDFQRDKVETEMRSAIQSGVKRIVFIHGVGQGILKQEVANLLKSKFKKYTFQDASFKEYGYGATMVILRRG